MRLNRKQWAWVLVDVGNSAFATTVLAALFPVYLPKLLPPDGFHLQWGGLSWTTTALSLWAYTVSGSVLITLLLAPLLGAWADEGGHRKKFLALFTTMGIIGTAFLSVFETWYWALLSFLIANVGFSAGNVFYNALLSTVAETEEEQHRLSLNGYAWGYIGGGLLLALNLMMILKYPWFGFESATVGLKISFLTVSVWWLCFVLPALFSIQEQGDASTELSVGIRHYVSKLWMTLKSLPAQKSLLLFILSFAFFNEGVQTVISMSTLFGKEVIQLSEQTLIGTLLMVQILGLPFTLSMSKATKFFGPKRVLIAAVLFWIGIVTYAHWMQHAYEFWILGVLVALVIGVSQALPRSIFASLIPRRRQAEYFSFFALSGKMTSLLGPLTFGLIRDLTGNPRLSILSLGAFFVLGLILLLFVSIDPQKVERID